MSEKCPKLLNLIANNENNKKLELRLGLPGDDQDDADSWFNKHVLVNKNSSVRETNDSLLTLNLSSNNNNLNSPWSCQQPNTALTINHDLSKESSQNCCTIVVGGDLQKDVERKKDSTNTAHLPNNSQKRYAPAPIVGWPPIRSFRKNLASTSTRNPVLKPDGKNKHKGLFVKINMDGVPIGRKVDLNAYNSYAQLSSAVDELFRDLLAAQIDSCEERMEEKEEQEKVIRGVLDGSGEYTLVYEDNEGDRMLVGDVPWHMFVSTVKRLRVLKSCDLPTLIKSC